VNSKQQGVGSFHRKGEVSVCFSLKYRTNKANQA